MRRKWFAAGFLLLCLTGGWLYPQQSQPQSQQPSTTPPPAPPRLRDDYGGVAFLSGLVLMEDGMPVPDHLQVDLLCQGRVIDQTRTLSDGVFGFELGKHRQSTVMDASASGGVFTSGNSRLGVTTSASNVESAGLGRIDMTGCEIRVVPMSGYYSNSITLGRMSIFNSEVGTIVLRPLERVKGSTVSTNTLQAPKKALKSLEKAREEMGKKKANYGKAEKELVTATELYPSFAEAWNLLGDVRVVEKDYQGAKDAYQHALESDPKYVTPHLGMAKLALEQKDWEQTVQYSAQAVDLNPYIAEAHYLNAFSNFQMGRYEPAEKSIEDLRKNSGKEKYPLVYYMLGAIYSSRGHYDQAATELYRFIEFPVSDSASTFLENVRQKLAVWESSGLIDKRKKP